MLFPAYIVSANALSRTVVMSGELDLAAAPTLTNLMDGPLDPTTIDLTAVTFLDATALGCFVAMDNRLRVSGARLTLVGTPEHIRKIFVITGLQGLLADDPPHAAAVTAPARYAPVLSS